VNEARVREAKKAINERAIGFMARHLTTKSGQCKAYCAARPAALIRAAFRSSRNFPLLRVFLV